MLRIEPPITCGIERLEENELAWSRTPAEMADATLASRATTIDFSRIVYVSPADRRVTTVDHTQDRRATHRHVWSA